MCLNEAKGIDIIMNKKTEEEIVKNFIKKNKQERVIWELNSPRKREEVIWRFDKPDIFIRDCLFPVEYMDKSQMENCLFQLSGNKNVYFISADYIGEMSLEKASKQATEVQVCIIYCGNGIGYYQGEQEEGKPPRFLLIKKM